MYVKTTTRSNLSRKSESIFAVKNRSRFCMTHVPKVGADSRLRKSVPVFDPVCIQPFTDVVPSNSKVGDTSRCSPCDRRPWWWRAQL